MSVNVQPRNMLTKTGLVQICYKSRLSKFTTKAHLEIRESSAVHNHLWHVVLFIAKSFKHGRKSLFYRLESSHLFALHGGTTIVMGLHIPRIFSTDFSSRLFSVALSAMFRQQPTNL